MKAISAPIRMRNRITHIMKSLLIFSCYFTVSLLISSEFSASYFSFSSFSSSSLLFYRNALPYEGPPFDKTRAWSLLLLPCYEGPSLKSVSNIDMRCCIIMSIIWDIASNTESSLLYWLGLPPPPRMSLMMLSKRAEGFGIPNPKPPGPPRETMVTVLKPGPSLTTFFR